VTAFNLPETRNAANDVILITGAGGTIGSSLALRFVLPFGPIQRVILLDHSEQNLYEVQSELLSRVPTVKSQLIAILGDVNDKALLAELFEKYRPTMIFHAAAFKHVPLMEENPIAAIRNNILGTWTLAGAALKHGARQLIMISTDKAANPRSIMGATKRVAELILSRLDSPATRMRSVRLGNVLDSTGSVVPLFRRQIQRGGPVTVTHPDASRYFISVDEAARFLVATSAVRGSATLFVSELGEPVKILDLAKKMIREAAASAKPGVKPLEIVFTGLRSGDKIAEDLLSATEVAEPTEDSLLRRICGPAPAAEAIDSAIDLISEKVEARDLPALIEVIRSLVPDYQPSPLLSTHTSAQLSATAKS
jgi:FlaA1/EpsC-like NDP-sugar epimerase